MYKHYPFVTQRTNVDFVKFQHLLRDISNLRDYLRNGFQNMSPKYAMP